MNTLRIVKDGASIQSRSMINIGHVCGITSINCYDTSDTIPISSPWTAEQAAVLLGINIHDLFVALLEWS
jgi:hypothetical protein